MVRCPWKQMEDAQESKWTGYFCPSSQHPTRGPAKRHNAGARYANDPNSHPGSGMLAVIATAFHQSPAALRHLFFVGQEADKRWCWWGGGGLIQYSAPCSVPHESKCKSKKGFTQTALLPPRRGTRRQRGMSPCAERHARLLI